MSRIFQYLSYPAVWLFSKAFMSTEFRGLKGLRGLPPGPLVIVANHISIYDSFLLRLVAGWKSLPLRFMGVTKFDIPILRFFSRVGVVYLVYALFGVFEVVPGRGLDKNLEVPKRILEKGGIVVVYPEGSINRAPRLMPFKQGAAVLAASTGAPVLPLSFREVNEAGKRTRVLISIGQPFLISHSADRTAATLRLESAVSELLAAKPAVSVIPAPAMAAEAVRT